MKTKNILRSLFTVIFIGGTLSMNAQKVYIHKKDGTAVEYNVADVDSISFTPPATAPVVDYSKLKLNEVSGVGTDDEKFYELINTGTVDINLEGCQIFYNANSSTGESFPPDNDRLTWIGNATQVVKAGELFTLLGRNTDGSFTLGLTPERILIITLKDPDGNIIDQCIRAADMGIYAVGRDYSFSRIPDGTGPFYFSAPTPNAKNGGILLLPTTQAPTIDYSQLVINEIDGNGKFVEIYNKGTEAVSLENLTLVKNETQVWWTGAAGKTIAADGYYVVAQSGGTDVFDENTGASGISPKQTVKFELKQLNGEVIDSFSRGVAPWSTSISDVTPDSFSRCPNGTGDFMLATPSPKAANPETGTVIPQE